MDKKELGLDQMQLDKQELDAGADINTPSPQQEPPPQVSQKGSEEIALKFGSFECSLSSAYTPVTDLAGIVLSIYDQISRGKIPKKTNYTS